MFAGNPDTVARQIKDFRKRVGGVEHIIMMTRQGLVTHAEAEKSFTLCREGAAAAIAGPAAGRSGRDRISGAAGGGEMSKASAEHPHPDPPPRAGEGIGGTGVALPPPPLAGEGWGGGL